jgi:hypothetical protein
MRRDILTLLAAFGMFLSSVTAQAAGNDHTKYKTYGSKPNIGVAPVWWSVNCFRGSLSLTALPPRGIAR